MPTATHFDGLPIEIGDTVSGDIRSITGGIPNSGARITKIDFSDEAEPDSIFADDITPIKATGKPGLQGLEYSGTVEEPTDG